MKKVAFLSLVFGLVFFCGCSLVTGTYHYSEGSRCLGTKNYEEARSHLEKAVELDPTCAGAHNNLALTYILMREEKKAWPHMRKAWMLEPKNAFYAKNLENYWNSNKAAWGFKKGTHKDDIVQTLGEPDSIIQKDHKSCLVYGSIVLYLEEDKLDREDFKIFISSIY